MQRQSPFAKPTPTVAPVMHCVVETGSRSLVAIITVMDVANSMQNPRVGDIRVRRLPNVRMTWYPKVSKPSTMAPPPKQSTQIGTSTWSWTTPWDQTSNAVANGAIALETSFAPCVNDAVAAVKICKAENMYSARLSKRGALECMSSKSQLKTAFRFCMLMTSFSIPRRRKRLMRQIMTEKLFQSPCGRGGMRLSAEDCGLGGVVGDCAGGGRINSSSLSKSDGPLPPCICTDSKSDSDART